MNEKFRWFGEGKAERLLYAPSAEPRHSVTARVAACRFMASDAVACGPSSSMDEGVVYVGCNSGMLFAVNATTGTHSTAGRVRRQGISVQYGMHPRARSGMLSLASA